MDEAYVTLVTNDAYALGALVLGQSLTKVGTNRALHCIITPGVSDAMRAAIASIYTDVTLVNVLDSGDEAHLALIQRPELGITFTKLHCWCLTQYRKCVFLDADCLVVQNCDELFDYPELSAAPDIGWPDIFNSGVFVFCPSEDTFHKLLQCAVESGSFDGGDQGLLNTFFSDWRLQGPSHRLSFIYNTSSSVVYSYLAAFRRFAKDVKIIHFLGKLKPWQHSTDRVTGAVQAGDTDAQMEHLQLWWNIFNQEVLPHLQPELRPRDELSTPTLDRLAHDLWTALPEDERSLPSRHVAFCPIVLQQTLSSSSLNEFLAKDSRDSAFGHVVFAPGGVVKTAASDQPVYEEIVRKLQRQAAKRTTYLVPLTSKQSSERYSDSITKLHSTSAVGDRAGVAREGSDGDQQQSNVMTKSLNIVACDSDRHQARGGEGGGDTNTNANGGGSGGGDGDKSGREGGDGSAGAAASFATTTDCDDVVPVYAQSLPAQSSPPRGCSPSGDGVENPNSLHAEGGGSSVSACYGFVAQKSDEKLEMINVKLQERVSTAEPTNRRRAWEDGSIDYLGKDSWENIQKKLDETLEKPNQ